MLHPCRTGATGKPADATRCPPKGSPVDDKDYTTDRAHGRPIVAAEPAVSGPLVEHRRTISQAGCDGLKDNDKRPHSEFDCPRKSSYVAPVSYTHLTLPTTPYV